jgi:hypothetical protein
MIKLFRNIRKNLLNEGKTTKYFKYAIGEIALVVIGIYLAIQFNNWNIENQNKRIVSNNIQLLIKSLEKDSLFFNQRKISIEKDKTKLSDFETRLKQPAANLDTLVQIVRYEYEPYIGSLKFSNDDTYAALVQSGEVNLLDRDLKMGVFSLYSFHKTAEDTNNRHFNIYLDWVTRLNSKYASNKLSTYSDGPIGDAIWKSATLIDLANAFNPVIQSKKNHYRLINGDLNKLITETNTVLEQLREAKKVHE